MLRVLTSVLLVLGEIWTSVFQLLLLAFPTSPRELVALVSYLGGKSLSHDTAFLTADSSVLIIPGMGDTFRRTVVL